MSRWAVGTPPVHQVRVDHVGKCAESRADGAGLTLASAARTNRKEPPMKKTLLATVVSLLAAASAHAGAKGNDFVTISTQFSYASGAMGSARSSSDALQSIGCSFIAYTGSSVYLSCSAIDAKNNRAWCTSSNV